jgi:phosphate/sulfate permease
VIGGGFEFVNGFHDTANAVATVGSVLFAAMLYAFLRLFD